MRGFKFGVSSISVLIISTGAMFLPAAARGNIYVQSLGNPAINASPEIGEYTDLGVPINTSLISDSLTTNTGGIVATGSDIFVTQRNDTVAEYTTSGALVNADLITTSGGIASIALSGSNLLLLSNNSPATPGWIVGEYTTGGAPVNTSLASGSGYQFSIAVSGSDVFVWTGNQSGDSTIGEYTTSGATINASLISGSYFFGNPNDAMAIFGSDLFVLGDDGVISEFTTSGATVNSALVQTAANGGIAISGSDLFAAGGDGVGEYTTSGGTVNANFISGLNNPWGIAIADVPEPAALPLLLLGGVSLLNRRRRA